MFACHDTCAENFKKTLMISIILSSRLELIARRYTGRYMSYKNHILLKMSPFKL